jgi:hypothetical protein
MRYSLFTTYVPYKTGYLFILRKTKNKHARGWDRTRAPSGSVEKTLPESYLAMEFEKVHSEPIYGGKSPVRGKSRTNNATLVKLFQIASIRLLLCF